MAGNPTPPAQPPKPTFRPAQPTARTAAEYRALYERMTLKDWLVYHQRNIVFHQSKWMGVRALKNPMDSWIYQELLVEVRPDVLIEIGSAQGGSTLFFAHVMDAMNHGTIISIDIDRSTYVAKHDRIVALTGDSSSPEILNQVAELCAGKRVMVLHDGDHRMPTVLNELREYSKFIPVGSYFLIEDGIVDLFEEADGFDPFEGDGPMKAIEQFLEENPDFVVDARCERYLLTYNPLGFLRRVR